jgi:hypothetical protein
LINDELEIIGGGALRETTKFKVIVNIGIYVATGID